MTVETYSPTSLRDVVTLTPSAITHFSNSATDKLVKFGITGGGCSGFQYMWTVHDNVEDHMDGDAVQEYDGFTLYVHSQSLSYVANCIIDYVTDITGSKIEIVNPNSQGGCGCGESVNFE